MVIWNIQITLCTTLLLLVCMLLRGHPCLCSLYYMDISYVYNLFFYLSYGILMGVCASLNISISCIQILEANI